VEISHVDLFNQNSCREILNFMIKLNADVKAYKSSLANAAGCHLSFLSLVLADKAFLGSERVFALCRFWNFSELETDYFMAVAHKEKSTSKHLADKYSRDIDKIRKQTRAVNIRLGDKTPTIQLSMDAAFEYASSWYFPLIHHGTKIPGLQSVKSLSERFLIKEEHVKETLDALEAWNLVSREGNNWRYSNHSEFPIDLSRFHKQFHQEMRYKVASAAYDSDRTERIRFSSYFSITNEDLTWINDLFREVITTISNRLAIANPPDDKIVILCIDLAGF